MKKGCGIILAIWLVLAGAYGYVAWQKDSPGGAGGDDCGARRHLRVRARRVVRGTLHRRARPGRASPGDRRRGIPGTAGSRQRPGPVRPLGAPLEGPFTGRPCVAYEYDVKRPGAAESEFAGVALAPCAIDTPRGSVRVLGWTVLDQFPRETSSAIDRGRGAAYLETAAFERLGLTSLIPVLSELLADDDGSIRKDFRIGAQTVHLEGRAIEERIVPVGAAVTLLGRWSEAKRGFAPTGPSSLNRLFPGDLTGMSRHVGASAVGTFALGLFLFLALHVILVPMYLLTPAPDATRSNSPESVWEERDCDTGRRFCWRRARIPTRSSTTD